jgi:TonB-dependent starch-binding outer membrane protein SusC
MVIKFFKKICLLFLFTGLSAIIADAQVIAKGNIKDENQNPLPGVTILQKGTNNGTTTDLDGNFALNVPQDATLVISYVGYLSEERALVSGQDVNVTMVPDIVSLGDVVVIGYGTIKKSDLTGAVASIKSDDFKNMPVTRVDDALQGKAAGVIVLQNSGQPGSAPAIRVRGLATVNGGNPLVVVDGISGGSLSDLNPNDIESMEVLKDGASQNIYGSAGGNGVILVTTKRGKSGTLKTNLDMYWGTQKPWHTVEVADAQEYAAIYNQYRKANGKTAYFPTDATGKYLASDSSELTNTNWQDEIFRKAFMQNYNLSITGGNEKSNVYFSIGYSTQDGTVKRTSDDRYTVRINSDHKIAKRIRIGESINLLRNINVSQDERNEYNSPVSTAVQMLPIVPIYATDGSGNYAYKGSSLSCNIKNPLAQIAYNNNKNIANSFNGNIYINLDLIKGLTYESRFGFGYYNGDYTRFTPTHTIGSVDDANATQSVTINEFQERVDNNYSWQWQNFLTYNFSLVDKNHFNLMAGMESGYYRRSYIRGIASGLFNNSEAMQNFFGTSDLGQLYGKPTETSGYAYFARLNYDYDGIVLFQAVIRRDYSSKFGPNKRVGNFPGASLGLKFSEFDFIKSLNIIDFGKIRIGYGETGNSDIEPFLYLNSYGSLGMNGYPFGGETQQGAGLLTAENPDLGWETVVNENAGIDLGMFRNRLSFSFDLYARRNKNMLLHKSVPYTVGYYISDPTQELGDANLDTRPMVNYGTLNNRGFEASLGFKNKSGDFSYSINLNLTHAVTTIDDIGDPIYAGTGRGLANVCKTANGEPVSEFIGYKTDGIYKEEDFVWYKNKAGKWAHCAPDPHGKNVVTGTDLNGNPVQYKVLNASAEPGDFKFVDANGDSTIGALDKVPIGNPNPNLIYGLNIDLGYKNFDLTMFWQGSQGNDIFNMLKVNLYTMDNGGLNVSPELIDGYVPALYDTKDKNSLPVLMAPAKNENTGKPRMDPDLSASDFYVEDGSYLRLKNIQLGYTLPSSITSKIKIERLRVYIGAKNLLTFTKYTGFDPEVGETTIRERGFDRGTYPQSKMYMLGLNVSF